MSQNLLSDEYRKQILKEISSDENKKRKSESFERSEIINKRAKPYIDKRLSQEFPETAKRMRKIYSVNIAQRVTEKLASVYQRAPSRSFIGDKGKELADAQRQCLEAIYEAGQINNVLQRANRVERYQNQAFLQVLPVEGKIQARIFQPHQIDAVPLDSNPEKAFAYITSAYDRSASLLVGDGRDQKIGDANDQENKNKSAQRFVWWSEEHNFITDGHGNILTEDVLNPIGTLPFIDISDAKENEFFVRKGSPVTDFAIEFAVILSDTSTVSRAQGYAQGVLKDFEQPSEIRVGHENFLFLKLDAGSTVQPSVEFISPSPNLEASLKLQDQLLSYFLTSEGVDPKIVSSNGEGAKYASGLERFLAQQEAFESSKEDLELFRWVESQVYSLIVKWVNHFTGTSNNPITAIDTVKLPDNSYITVQFGEPELSQSKAEQETSQLTLVEKGLISKVMAVQNMLGLDEESAIAHLQKVQEHSTLGAPKLEVVPGVEASDETAVKGTGGAVTTEKVADSALNGAQVSAMIEIVAQVAAGQIPRESAVAIIEKAFLISSADADRLLGSAGKGFVPTQEEAPVQAPAKKAAV